MFCAPLGYPAACRLLRFGHTAAMPKKWLMLLMALAVSLSERPVEIVMIDRAAEAELGKFDTPAGKIKAHRIFYYQLCTLYDQLVAPVTGTWQ
jgi:hypothetical protein